jgi:hypothetical protein
MQSGVFCAGQSYPRDAGFECEEIGLDPTTGGAARRRIIGQLKSSAQSVSRDFREAIPVAGNAMPQSSRL